jgi:hypothetical protein
VEAGQYRNAVRWGNSVEFKDLRIYGLKDLTAKAPTLRTPRTIENHGRPRERFVIKNSELRIKNRRTKF